MRKPHPVGIDVSAKELVVASDFHRHTRFLDLGAAVGVDAHGLRPHPLARSHELRCRRRRAPPGRLVPGLVERPEPHIRIHAFD